MAVFATACGGDDERGNEAGNGGLASDQDGGDAAFGNGSLDVDTCSLLTDEEVSAWLGMDLVAREDSLIGCLYGPPGQQPPEGVPEAPMGSPSGGGANVFSVRAFEGEGDAATAGADVGQIVVPGDPDAAVVTELPGGDHDAVAVLHPSGSVYYVVARSGDLFVEFHTSGLLLGADSPEIDQAAEMADLALERLESAA